MYKGDKAENTLLDEFQYSCQDLLIRNKSILDSMTKMTDSCAGIKNAVKGSNTMRLAYASALINRMCPK